MATYGDRLDNDVPFERSAFYVFDTSGVLRSGWHYNRADGLPEMGSREASEDFAVELDFWKGYEARLMDVWEEEWAQVCSPKTPL